MLTGEEPTTVEMVSGNRACSIAHEQRLTQWKPMDGDWLAHYLGLHSKHSYQQGLYVEETRKGDRECVDTSAEHLPATHAPSEFSVLISGDIQEHGVP